MTDRILVVLTSHGQLGETGRQTGFYVPEVAHPWRVFTAAGYDVDLISVRGGAPPMDGLDPKDPVQEAFFADPAVRAQLTATRRPDQVSATDYAAVLFAGGHGAMWDLPDDKVLTELAADVYQAGGVVSAVCHGVAGLVNVTLPDGRYLVHGRELAAFTNAEEHAVGLTDVVPFLLADRLEQRGARHSAAPDFQPYVVTDGRLVTGQNPASSTGLAEAVIHLLETAPEPDGLPVARTRVSVPVRGSDKPMDSYLARPARPGHHPGVVLAPYLYGVDGHTRRFADRVAAAGYCVLVPDFHHRTAAGVELPDNEDGRARGFELLSRLTVDSVLADVRAAERYLRDVTGSGTRPGIIGISVGGHLAFLAASEIDFAATAVFYPGWLTGTDLPLPAAAGEPTLSRASRINGRLLVLLGADDHLIPQADQDRIGEALRVAGVQHELVVYPHTPHAFLFPGTVTFQPAAAADAWQRMLAMFNNELRGSQ